MEFICDIGIDMNELDDAFDLLKEMRIKEENFIEMLARSLNKILDDQ